MQIAGVLRPFADWRSDGTGHSERSNYFHGIREILKRVFLQLQRQNSGARRFLRAPWSALLGVTA